MTIQFAGCLMTAKDFHFCSEMLKKLEGSDCALTPLLREKVESATIVAAEQMDPLVVTLNSRVEFAIDEGAAQTRIVVRSEFRHGLVGLTLPITTPRGLALLGLRQGQCCLFTEHGRTRNIFARRVLYQPEARRFTRDNQCWRGLSANVIDFADARSVRARLGQTSGASPIRS